MPDLTQKCRPGGKAGISSVSVVNETLTPFVDRYLTEQRRLGTLSPSTAISRSYRLYRLSASFGRRPIAQFTARAIERWLLSLEHLAPGTRRLHLANVRTFSKWLIAQGVIRKDPTRGFEVHKPRAVPRALNPDKIALTLGSLPDTRARTVVVLMLYCGLRCMEVAGLQTGDYDARARTVMVVGKGGHERVLPVPVAAAVVVDLYLAERGVVSGPLVRSLADPSKGLKAATISELVGGWMRDAGVKTGRFDGVSAHALRHTAGSDVLEQSGNLRAVQEMLGHASLTTTQIYLRRASLGQLRQAMEGRRYAAPSRPVVPSAG